MELKNHLSLVGKFALITGASRGIGRAIAIKLAVHGAEVFVNYNQDSNSAEDVCNDIKKAGGEAYAMKADVSKEQDRLKLKSEISRRTKKLDILVNNAGIFDENDGPDASQELFENMITQHATATARLCSILKPMFSKNASIINVSSIHGITARPHAFAYSASKAAEHSITQSLAQALAPIRVNTISPGPVQTDMWNGTDVKEIEFAKNKTLLKRFASPDEIAETALFLASDASSYITGINLPVDGGSLLK